MTKEKVIKKLRIKAIKNGFFIEKPLCEIEKSCSQSKEIVVDYDHTKEEIQKTLKGYKPFESCDALKIEEQVLNFIEMKSIDEYLKHYSTRNRNKFMKKDFGLKYTDSIYILGLLLKRNDMEMTIEESEIILATVKNYIVLIDREYRKDVPEEFLTRLELLQDISEQEKEIYEASKDELASSRESEDEFRLKEVVNKIESDLDQASGRIPHKIQYCIMTPSEFRQIYS